MIYVRLESNILNILNRSIINNNWDSTLRFLDSALKILKHL